MHRTAVVAALGASQTLAWASSYYLIAILADPIAETLQISRAAIFGFFSASLLISAFLAPAVGRAIDRRGGRDILVLSNFVFAAGLALLASAQGLVGLAFAWAVLGTAMALGLYDSAFATLAGLYGSRARGAITGITLVAGFASTIGWPVTAFFNEWYGWRGACLAWAGFHLVLGLPLNRFAVPAASPPAPAPAAPRDGPEAQPSHRTAMVLLAFTFAAAWFVTGAIAAHLPRLLQAAGATTAVAIGASALLGPAQVAARLVEFGLLQRVQPIVTARLATCLHPIGAAMLFLIGPPAAVAFALLHGAGNGLLTIAKGTLPLAIFGPRGYGYRTGLIGAPARATHAASPLVFGLILDNFGAGAALATSTGMTLAALGALLLLRGTARETSTVAAD
jgi:predicted MFS family arabinose efflux permease